MITSLTRTSLALATFLTSLYDTEPKARRLFALMGPLNGVRGTARPGGSGRGSRSPAATRAAWAISRAPGALAARGIASSSPAIRIAERSVRTGCVAACTAAAASISSRLGALGCRFAASWADRCS
jgi:hypothetical protein